MGKPNWLDMERVPFLHTAANVLGRAALRNKVAFAMMCVWRQLPYSQAGELHIAK